MIWRFQGKKSVGLFMPIFGVVSLSTPKFSLRNFKLKNWLKNWLLRCFCMGKTKKIVSERFVDPNDELNQERKYWKNPKSPPAGPSFLRLGPARKRPRTVKKARVPLLNFKNQMQEFTQLFFMKIINSYLLTNITNFRIWTDIRITN